MHLDNLLWHATPAVIMLITGEALFMMKEHRHDNKDMLTSFSLIFGRIPVAAITNGMVLYFYTIVYHHRFFFPQINTLWLWVICFFADDFSYYWFHRLSHQVRFLWASHKVHHSSEKFTFSSGLRLPWTSELTGNFLFWAWMPLIGIDPYMVIWMKSVSVLYQFWIHTESIKKLPQWVEGFFNTPSHHRVHHGSNVEYLDKNHGGTLIIWDKFFGTFQPEIFQPKYGLSENIHSYNPFVIAFHEWKKLYLDMKKSPGLNNRLNYFIKAPGWSPDGSTKTARQLQHDLKAKK